jgi:diaminopimelate decarboxylase
MADELSVFPPSTGQDAAGRLALAGVALADIADRFGTPAFVVDEAGLRATARAYKDAFARHHPASDVFFASKAFPCAPVTAIFAEEGLGCDVASAGELRIALAAGFPGERILLHGNAKRDEDIALALEHRVRYVVIDGFDDVERLARLATAPQDVLVRVNPGVVADTHPAMATGDAASKFGLPLADLPRVLERIAAVPLLRLAGLHVHIGSQLLDLATIDAAAAALVGLGSHPVYDVGGGLGVRYLPGDLAPSIEEYAERLAGTVHAAGAVGARLVVEPGRSLVAGNCLTLYRVVTVKRAGKTFVAVDGGMADNLEPALYGVRFAPLVVDRDGARERCELVGMHCESGDIVCRDAQLAAPRVGDLVAVPVTGAYCYSLANNYNGALKPPVVLCRDGEARAVVRRERYEDLLARDVAHA